MTSVAPENWFLDTNGSELQPAYTSGNRVRALIDGQSFMARVSVCLRALAAGGYVHLAAWRLTPDVIPAPGPAAAQTIAAVLTDCVSSGVVVRSLLWYVPGTIGDFGASHGAENLHMAQLLEGLGAQVLLDDRLPAGTFASHHQKVFVMGDDQHGHRAFVGGMDIALDRWDRPAHDEPTGRQPELFKGWHDIQAEIVGPAVGQLWRSFVDRWNDPRRANHTVATAGNSSVTAIPDSEAPPSLPATGNCHVQVLRTYPCASRDHTLTNTNDHFPFAPEGELTYEAGLIKAITAAEHFVYVEDQYLWPCAVVDALADAVGRGVTVIMVLNHVYDVPGLEPFHNFLRQSCLDLLRARDADRVFVYHLLQDDGDDIYVHAKTLIIDDRYAVIGTANLNRRSMRNDTEIAVAIVDSNVLQGSVQGQLVTVTAFARDLRKRLWREHLGVEVDDPLTATGAPRLFPTENGLQVGHIVVHQVPQPRFCRPSVIPFVFMNPEPACLP